MNAADFLARAGRAAPTHPITIRLFGKDAGGAVADAEAAFVFVPDQDRLAAVDAAADALASLKAPATAERRAAEEAFHLLPLALRQKEDRRLAFFDSPTQAKSMLVEAEAIRLRNEYERFIATNFPASIAPEVLDKIREDAKHVFFADLLTSYGYWPILRALPSLAIGSGASLTPTS